jgi:hypothetical protein
MAVCHCYLVTRLDEGFCLQREALMDLVRVAKVRVVCRSPNARQFPIICKASQATTCSQLGLTEPNDASSILLPLQRVALFFFCKCGGMAVAQLSSILGNVVARLIGDTSKQSGSCIRPKS